MTARAAALSPRRVVVVGSVRAEIVLQVPDLPERGSSRCADSAAARAGAGYHVLLAARAAGLQAAHVGALGSGPIAAMIEHAMRAEGIEPLMPVRSGDQGFTVLLADPGGATTRICAPGVESHLDSADLADIRLGETDLAYLSCQDLIEPQTAAAITAWCCEDDGLGAALLLLEPGSLVSDVPDEVLDAVLARTDVVVVRTHELALMTGADAERDPQRALADLADLLAPGAVAVLVDAEGSRRVHEQGAADGRTSDPSDASLGTVATLLDHLERVQSRPPLAMAGLEGNAIAALLGHG